MTTALHRFLGVITPLLAAFAYGVLGQGPLAALLFYVAFALVVLRITKLFQGVILAVIAFGLWCVYTVLNRAAHISDAPEAQRELQQQIIEVQKELKAKGIIS